MKRSLALHRTYVADLVLLSVTFVWGIMFVFVKEAVTVMPPFSHLAARFMLAAAMMIAWHRLSRDREPLTRSLLRDGAVMGFWLFAGFAFQTVGLKLTTVSKAGFITGLSVILVPVIASLFMGSRLNKLTVAGIAVATFGMGLLSINKAEPLQLGDLLVLCCAFGFAMHILMTGRYTTRHHPVSLAMVQITIAALLNAFAAFIAEEWRAAMRPQIWAEPAVIRAIVIGAVFATAFAFWAQTHFQRYTTATHTAIIFSSEPVFAAGAGILLAGDSLSLQSVCGSALILAGILLAEWRSGAEISQSTG